MQGAGNRADQTTCVTLRDATPDDLDWLLRECAPLGGPVVVSGGAVCDLAEHPARIAERGDERVGFAATRLLAPGIAELLALRTMLPGRGIGTALVDDAAAAARRSGGRRLAVDTTNDNMRALRFYQRRGFVIRDWRRGGFAGVLRLKGLAPDVPVIGIDGIEIRDVIRLERSLGRAAPGRRPPPT